MIRLSSSYPSKLLDTAIAMIQHYICTDPFLTRGNGIKRCINISMRLIDLLESGIAISLTEGGWDDVITQGTVIDPGVVKLAMKQAERFVKEFNTYLSGKGIPPIKVGTLTGSSVYHDVDPEDTKYGDVDLQVIVPETADTVDMTTSQLQGYWYGLMDEFVQSTNPDYIYPKSNPGHPIFSISGGRWVQVDLMPHQVRLAKWGAARTIPERGVKGLLHGNMFSVLGELLTMSIQHAGVQYKERDGVKQPYSTTRKNYDLHTLTTDPETFVLDIFKHEARLQGISNPRIDPLLSKHPGKDLKDVKVSNLVNSVKGLARSFEENGMYGKGDLSAYSNANDFLQQFWDRYQSKAMKDIEAKKRDKAVTPEAKARAESDRNKVLNGLEYVKRSFGF